MQNIDIKLFGQVYDITEDLCSEAPKIKIKDKEYEFKTGFKTVMELDKLFKGGNSDVEFVEKFLTIAMSKKDAKELIDMNLPMKAYKQIIKIIGDEIKGSDDESESGNAT